MKDKNKQRNELTKVANESDIAKKVGEAMSVGSRKEKLITMPEHVYIDRLSVSYVLGHVRESKIKSMTDAQRKALNDRATKYAKGQLRLNKRMDKFTKTK